MRAAVILIALLNLAAAPATQQSLPAGMSVQVVTIDPTGTVIDANLDHAGPGVLFDTIANQSTAVFNESSRQLFADSARQHLTLTARWDHTLFWDALDAVCRQMNLTVTSDDAIGAVPHQLMLADGASKRPTSCDSAVRLSVVALTRDAWRSFLPAPTTQPAGAAATPSQTRGLTLWLAAMFEPKIPQPMLLRQIRLLRADDELGHSLIVPSKEPADLEILSPVHRIEVALNCAIPGGHRLVDLQGQADFMIPRELVRVRFSDAADVHTDIRLGHNLLRINAITHRAEQNHTMGMTLTRGDNVSESQWMGDMKIFMSGARGWLLTPGGKQFPPYSGRLSGGTRDSVSMTFRTMMLTPMPNQLTVYLEIPSSMQTFTSKFHFVNLPLP